MVTGTWIIMVATTGDSHQEQPHLFLAQWCLAVHTPPFSHPALVPRMAYWAQGWKEATAKYTLPFLVTESFY